LDPDGLDGEDLEHSSTKPRRLRLAKGGLGRILVIAYTTRRRGHEEITRILSARRASREERARLIAIRLDAGVLRWIRKTADEIGRPYQSLINDIS